MRDRKPRASGRVLAVLLAAWVSPLAAVAEVTPPEFKVAFFGDQGSDANADRVLDLVAAEGARAVVHIGDFDYRDNPSSWDARVTEKLGADFPYFATAGNHDAGSFDGSNGYQAKLAARMRRLGIAWEGDLGNRSSHRYAGIQFVLTAPDIFDKAPGDAVYAPFIRSALGNSSAIWRIRAWLENMARMTPGRYGDAVGWGVYEESRRGGAIIATAHDHVYSRTHLLSDCSRATVASTAEPLVLAADAAATGADEGRSFVFVSGLGGKSRYSQTRSGAQFASVYTRNQGSRYGVLFGVFHTQGDPRLAHFYFKNVDGQVIDDFTVRSTIGDAPPPAGVPELELALGVGAAGAYAAGGVLWLRMRRSGRPRAG
jgi:hypothetical protein